MHSEETFTGFKWIGKIVTERPDLRFVFGYEQALGYLVTNRPLDKDGISAAVMMAEIAGLALADGVTLQDRLDAIAERFGRYVTADLSVRLDPAHRRGLGACDRGRPAGRGRWAGGRVGVVVPARRTSSAWCVDGGPAAADPPERHRAEGQAVRRGRRRRSRRPRRPPHRPRRLRPRSLDLGSFGAGADEPVRWDGSGTNRGVRWCGRVR